VSNGPGFVCADICTVEPGYVMRHYCASPFTKKDELFLQYGESIVRRSIFLMVVVLLMGGLLSGGHRAFAEGITIHAGTTLTLGGAVLDLNCTDVTVENGGTLNLDGGVIEECGDLIVGDDAAVVWGAGTIEYCQSSVGTVSVNPAPDSLDAPWIVEGPSGYYHVGSGDETLPSLAQGEYTCTWLDEAGWVTPSPNPATYSLVADGTITFTGTYVLRDTDEDGLPDTWEEQYDLNPLVDDASEDEDGDGFTNLAEYQAGTDPTDPDSHPRSKAMPWIHLLLDD